MTATQSIAKKTVKSSRLGLRTTPEQEVVLRRAAEVCHKSLTEFILLDRPAEENIGLRDLFSRPAPWDEQCP